MELAAFMYKSSAYSPKTPSKYPKEKASTRTQAKFMLCATSLCAADSEQEQAQAPTQQLLPTWEHQTTLQTNFAPGAWHYLAQ